MSRILYESEKRINTNNGFGVNGHEGLDLLKRDNEEHNKVYALTKGTVIQAIDGKDMNRGSTGTESYGNFVMICHENGLESTYAHLLKGSVAVKIGQVVDKDTMIGIMGETGNAYGRHLHIRIKKNGSLVDPTPYLTMDFGDTVQESKPQTTQKSIEELANEVIQGKWGNGEDRKTRLIGAGYNAQEVQNKVNSILGVKTQSDRKSIDEVAREVIQGKYGNQPERQRKLEAEGYNYREVQNRVNQILKG